MSKLMLALTVAKPINYIYVYTIYTHTYIYTNLCSELLTIVEIHRYM